MKVLITGNMGYVGPSVIDQLKRSFPDITLIGFDSGYFAHCLTGPRRFPEIGLANQYFGDMRKFPKEILAGIDAIVHLAAISNDPMGNRFEDVTLDINYRASVALAKSAKAAGVKSFVFASSCSVYGISDGDGLRSEASELSPLTAYAKSKILTENELKALADNNFNVSCLRFATACGASDRLRLDLVLNDFVASAVSKKEITILSDGTPWRPLINVKDMARAIEWGVVRKIDNGGAFIAVNVGRSDWNVQVKELADAVAEQVGDVAVSVNPNAAPDKRSYRVDFSLFKSLAPNHQPLLGLRETIAGLKEQVENLNTDISSFRDSDFMRLKVLTGLQSRRLLSEKLEWIG